MWLCSKECHNTVDMCLIVHYSIVLFTVSFLKSVVSEPLIYPISTLLIVCTTLSYCVYLLQEAMKAWSFMYQIVSATYTSNVSWYIAGVNISNGWFQLTVNIQLLSRWNNNMHKLYNSHSMQKPRYEEKLTQNHHPHF